MRMLDPLQIADYFRVDYFAEILHLVERSYESFPANSGWALYLYTYLFSSTSNFGTQVALLNQCSYLERQPRDWSELLTITCSAFLKCRQVQNLTSSLTASVSRSVQAAHSITRQFIPNTIPAGTGNPRRSIRNPMETLAMRIPNPLHSSITSRWRGRSR